MELVGTIERIMHVAKIVKKEYENGNDLIVVVSMAGKTNELLDQSKKFQKILTRELTLY